MKLILIIKKKIIIINIIKELEWLSIGRILLK